MKIRQKKNNKKLKILTSDYLANGGDNMFFFKKKTQKKLNIKLNNVSVENLTRSEVLKMEKKIKGLKKELRKLRKK